jgi:hypothetical protein
LARTWGQIRLELRQQFPSIHIDLLSSWIQQAYESILDSRPWEALRAFGVLTTVAPYSTGTASFTNGSQTVTGAGTAWTSAMDGRKIRLAGLEETYTIMTVDSATQASIDRPYSGDSLAGAAYEILQDEYTLDAGVKTVLTLSPPYMDPQAPSTAPRDMSRCIVSVPSMWWPIEDQQGTPTVRRVQLWPVPDAAYSIQYEYAVAVTGFDGSNTHESPMAFVHTAAITEAVRAKCYTHLGEGGKAQLAAAGQMASKSDMGQADTARRGPAVFKFAPWMTRHSFMRGRRG